MELYYFLAIRGVISFQIVGKLIIPIIFVGIGLSIIFNETLKSKVSDKVKEAKKNGLETYAATFGEQNVKKMEKISMEQILMLYLEV